MKDFKKCLEDFRNKKIVILGDLMLDKYIFGKVDRISPEAPVPIVRVESEKYVPGGAANAAANVSALGGEAHLFGIVGNDSAKDIFMDVAKSSFIKTDGVIIDKKKPTIQKIRVLGPIQQLLRIDYEDVDYISKDIHEAILRKIMVLRNVDAIIISDYAKGTITKDLLGKVIAYAKERNIPVIIDPKPKHAELYVGATIITPNKKEAEEIVKHSIDTMEDVEKAGKSISEKFDCSVLLTLGEKGVALFEKGKNAVHIPAIAREVFDVSGAGDTVIATLSLALSSGASLSDASIIANHAAGIKVGKIGTAPVYLNELSRSLEKSL
ncbi:D-glycero-beta-D-manno-heptose-7-phosphate kinase [Candidatus Woesearchaeota archaeon]|nr:D-glycero-beta-D-manno-heptose-7-phosphate kinase [Candidatus Woesearchaeota archaeon]